MPNSRAKNNKVAKINTLKLLLNRNDLKHSEVAYLVLGKETNSILQIPTEIRL